MAVEASRSALENAGIKAESLSGIIVATATPDYPGFPSTACVVQEKLGLSKKPMMAFDITAACSGFNYALTTAEQFIQTGFSETILVIGVDCLSEITDWSDRGTCILFGDGAGAVIVGNVSQDKGILYSNLYSDGSLAEVLKVSFPESTKKRGTLKDNRPYIEMDGKTVFKTAVRLVAPSISKGLESLGLNSSDIDWLVLHQANKRIIDAVTNRLEIDENKVVVNVDRFGNTSAASIPLALGECVENSMFKDGDLVVCCGFGAGFTWGINIIRWGK